MDAARLRAEFPVLGRLAYLNAGTDGPIPARAVAAARAELDRQAGDGRAAEHFERRHELADAQRGAYAGLLACRPQDVALTTCTTEGIVTALAGLDLRPGDEVLTSDQEHPGLLGPLGVARRLRGIDVRVAPFARLADAVGPKTRLVACSHVSWMDGEVAPAALAALPDDVPVLLDGAQSLGAVPVDVAAQGCDVYSAAGQKWLCGPDGTGVLYVSPHLRDRLEATRPSYMTLADPGAGLDASPHPDARRYDAASLSAEALAFAAGALRVLGEAGWDAIHARARDLAARLADELAARGHEVAPRGETTLVSFGVRDPAGTRERLSQRGVVVRDLPGTSWLRASVGAWNDESDLERLLDGVAAR